jgi:hypothetical protein
MKKNLLIAMMFCSLALSAFAQDSSSDNRSKVTVKLQVGNLPPGTAQSELKAFFNRAGVEVTSVQILKKNSGGQRRTNGLVEVNVDQAENAVKLTNGKQLKGRTLVINILAADRQKIENAKNVSTPPTTAPTPEPIAVVSPSPVVDSAEESSSAQPATPPTPASEPIAVVSPSPVVTPAEQLPTPQSTPEPEQTLTAVPAIQAPVPTTVTIAPVKSAAALRADEIIQKNIQSRGGWDKIKAINTIRMTGKMIMMQGMEAPMTMEMARPGKIRTEFILQGMTAVQTCDGTDGWILNPFLGKTEAERITGQQLEELKTQANFEGMLMDYEAKGYQVEFADNEDLAGTPTYKLKITKKNGDISYLWLEAQSYLEIQSSAKTNLNGQEVEAITMFGDFEESGGVLFAHSIQTRMADLAAPAMTLTIEKIEINPSLSAARFGKP